MVMDGPWTLCSKEGVGVNMNKLEILEIIDNLEFPDGVHNNPDIDHGFEIFRTELTRVIRNQTSW